MRLARRLAASLFVLAHVWVAALPCAPVAGGEAGDRVVMSIDDARLLLELARDGAGEPPCHGHGGSRAEAAAPFEGRLIFLLPACPCGCDQRAPVAGASTARVGAGVPPTLLAADPTPRPTVVAIGRTPATPSAPRALPDPVPRYRSIA